MEQTAGELLGVGGNLHTPADVKGQKSRVLCEPKRRHRGRKERHEVANSVSFTLAQRSIIRKGRATLESTRETGEQRRRYQVPRATGEQN